MANLEDLIMRDTRANQPAAGIAGRLYYVTDEGVTERDNGTTWDDVSDGGDAGGGLFNTNISPTTTNIPAAVGTRYFADVSGLTAARNFVLPTCVAGDEIELKITVGDDTYALVVIGDTAVTINGGAGATEWSRLFIAGEAVRLVATSANNWQVMYDGRIPCLGLMTLSANDTTNTAAANTILTWDNAVINTGELCDLTNFRFNIRRAGYYTVTGLYNPAAALSSGNYIISSIYLNGTGGTQVQEVYRQSGGSNNLESIALPARSQLCVVGDNLAMYYRPQASPRGALAAVCWFQIKEG